MFCMTKLYGFPQFGRLFYLDMGILTGFAAVLMGALGFRSRHSKWLSNRNYLSGKHHNLIDS